MKYDIDRVNDMLTLAKLPTVESHDMRNIPPTERGSFSVMAIGLHRLETHYGLTGVEDWRRSRKIDGVKLTIGARIKSLEFYQSLCADPSKPFRIEKVL